MKKNNIKYITQISRQDMSDIVDAVQIYGGDGIIVDKTKNGLEIRLDDEYINFIIKKVIAYEYETMWNNI